VIEDRSLIEQVLPDAAVGAEIFGDQTVELFDAEEAQLARAVPKRRREYTTARAAARRALAGLGYPPVPVLRGEHGEPLWPAGVVGSLTHCDGYRACAVADADLVPVLGLDAEPAEPLSAGVFDRISVPAERGRHPELAAAVPDLPWDRLLFCAKEATYKAWYPQARRWLGFADADIRLDPGGTFEVEILVDGPEISGLGTLRGFKGRWATGHGVLVAAIAQAITVSDR
jgi:4'-phosphopantetheinyl transferase EntD